MRWAFRGTPRVPGTTDAGLSGVSCTSSGACTAVGFFTNHGGTNVALAERWNGVRWVIQNALKVPGDSHFEGVSCASSRACTAVGDSAVPRLDGGPSPPQQLTERWNGVRWAIQQTPLVAENTDLTGVSCPSRRVCTAVGIWSSLEGPPELFAERWNGVSWAIQRTPPPADAAGINISGVSCASSDACTAVGQQVGPGGLFADRWNGASWAIQSPPNPAGTSNSDNTLWGVSCTSRSACTAVGSGAYAEQWNGVSWTIQNTLNRAGA